MGSYRRRLLLACLLLSLPLRASAQTTALFFQSQSGDWVGQGQTRTYLPADGTFTFTSTQNSVSGRVAGPSFSFWWDMLFAAPQGTPLTVGTYPIARQYTTSGVNALTFTGSGRTCATFTGRFVVREAVFGSGGTVEKFAADFEQHCENGDPGLAGAIRFNSSISSLSPFDGAYPSWTLTVGAPANGTVTSASGLNCGTGGAACALTFGSAQSVTLTATADPGYVFLGWTGECRGATTITIRVNFPKQCGALFDAASATSRTLFFFDSKTGDTVGSGEQQFYSSGNSVITSASLSYSNTLSFTVAAPTAASDVTWTISLGAPHYQPLTVGTYENALMFAGERPSLRVNYCTTSWGRFVIRDFAATPDGTVTRAAVDLEYHCGTSDGAFFAAIRYNSTVVDPVPFGGTYPVYRLTLTTPSNGTVSGGGLTCGSGGTACVVSPGAPTTVTLTAAADPGFLFAGWSGATCSGGSSIDVRVNGVEQCSALFEPLVTSSPRTRLVYDYMADALGTGRPAERDTISKDNSEWTVYLSGSNYLEFDVYQTDAMGIYTSRRFVFALPSGQTLQTGVVYAATRYSTYATPSMDVALSCSRLTGRFIIRELTITGYNVTKAAVDFEHHCNDADAAAFGSLRYNSLLDALPFDGDYPRYRVLVTPPDHGTVVSSAGISCGGSQALCRADFGTPVVVTLTAVPDPGYTLIGWTGPCHGAETITFRLNTIRQCSPVFDTVGSTAPQKILRLVSQPGDTVLSGRSEIYSLVNSAWYSGIGSGTLSFNVSGMADGAETTWFLSFSAPTGQTLVPGTYTNASGSYSSSRPGLSISGNSRYCNAVGSTFTINTLVLGSANKVSRASISFEQHCDTVSSPALTGTIEYVDATDANRLSLDKHALSFASVVQWDNTIGMTTAPQQVRLSQSAGPDVSWVVNWTDSALRVSPMSGTGAATLTVSIVPGLAGAGAHTMNFTVSTGGVALTPVTVIWTLYLAPTSPPFGVVETPAASLQPLSGAVAVTGWALDDVEVTSLQIWRQAHPLDPAAAIFSGPGPQNGKVYIGNATFIDGARPDVEAAYAVPNRSRSGWGYMLLTRGFIWDGQGPFTLHAIATDRDGHTAEIGSVFVVVDNSGAMKPFGTIDTPGQGGAASGVAPNTGWVITPDATATIPAANVRVLIDGVVLPGTPATASRADISATFPTMDTSQAGRGMFIDTRGYADGVHTIAWVVTDSKGRTEGIGSRFFQIANAGSGALRAVPSVAVDEAAQDVSSIQVRRGFDLSAPFDTVTVSSEPIALDIGELDRVEIRLPAVADAVYSGFLRALGELRPLPAGAAIDAANGTFTWQPGPGFLGSYDLVFVAQTGRAAPVRYEIRVRIASR